VCERKISHKKYLTKYTRPASRTSAFAKLAKGQALLPTIRFTFLLKRSNAINQYLCCVVVVRFMGVVVRLGVDGGDCGCDECG